MNASTHDTDGTYAMIYAPVGRQFEVRMDVIKGNDVVAWWYNPRNGSSEKIGTFPSSGAQKFLPPTHGEKLDWFFVPDDASRGYQNPGKR